MLDELVQKYIALRDQKAVLKAKYDADKEKIDVALAKCESYFLVKMNEEGLEALPTAAGVPYKQHRTSAVVADWEISLGDIIKREDWGMLERRVSKEAVAAYIEANGDVPPGVKWRDEVVVNVRRK